MTIRFRPSATSWGGPLEGESIEELRERALQQAKQEAEEDLEQAKREAKDTPE